MADYEKLETALATARALVEDLKEKRTRAQTELERLGRAKAPLVLPAATEGNAKQAQLDKLNQRIAEQRLKVEDLDAAIEQAGLKVVAIEDKIENASDLDRSEELAKRHEELRGTDEEIDRLLGELAATFRKRLELITATERLMDRGMLKRLGFDELRTDFSWSVKTKGPATRAARAAGLEAFLDMPYVGKPVPLSGAGYPHLEQLILRLRNGGQKKAA